MFVCYCVDMLHSQEFDGATKEFSEASKSLPESAEKESAKGKKAPRRTSDGGVVSPTANLVRPLEEPLRSLDVFAGCGGKACRNARSQALEIFVCMNFSETSYAQFLTSLPW